MTSTRIETSQLSSAVQLRLVLNPIAAITALIFIVGLAVYKPFARIPRRKR